MVINSLTNPVSPHWHKSGHFQLDPVKSGFQRKRQSSFLFGLNSHARSICQTADRLTVGDRRRITKGLVAISGDEYFLPLLIMAKNIITKKGVKKLWTKMLFCVQIRTLPLAASSCFIWRSRCHRFIVRNTRTCVRQLTHSGNDASIHVICYYNFYFIFILLFLFQRRVTSVD